VHHRLLQRAMRRQQLSPLYPAMSTAFALACVRAGTPKRGDWCSHSQPGVTGLGISLCSSMLDTTALPLGQLVYNLSFAFKMPNPYSLGSLGLLWTVITEVLCFKPSLIADVERPVCTPAPCPHSVMLQSDWCAPFSVDCWCFLSCCKLF
jgi:hypothetical protein